MSVQLPRPLPPMTTVLGAIDAEGRKTAAGARDHTVAAVRRLLPARTGRARRAARGAVRRSPTGYTVEVKPTKRERYESGVTALEVTRWIEEGTGVYGKRGRPYPPRRAEAFRLPGGWRTTMIAGQRAQHPYRRAQTGEQARVQRILADGAVPAARAAERALGGRR
jgi:hypothetical protein